SRTSLEACRRTDAVERQFADRRPGETVNNGPGGRVVKIGHDQMPADHRRPLDDVPAFADDLLPFRLPVAEIDRDEPAARRLPVGDEPETGAHAFDQPPVVLETLDQLPRRPAMLLPPRKVDDMHFVARIGADRAGDDGEA